MYAVTVEFHVKQAHIAAFRTAVLKQAANSLQKEENCLQFEVFSRPDDPSVVFLYEAYTDRAAFDAHCNTDFFHDFSKTVDPWVEDKRLDVWQPMKTP